MRRLSVIAIAVAVCGTGMSAQQGSSTGPYKVLRVQKVGGDGGFDYVYADAAGRRLYIPRSGPNARVDVFDLDSLSKVGTIAKVSARGAAVDPASHRGFVSSKPVTMFDTTSLAVLTSIDVQGNPDGILFDPFNERVYVFSHTPPNATVINAKDGTLVGTLDLGGAPEQAVTDGKGHLYIDLEDKDAVAVVDAKTMAVTGRYDLAGKGGGPAGLGFDAKNGILFVGCHDPQTMVVMDAKDGRIITTLPIGAGVDGTLFNPATGEAFSSQADGTLTVVKENSPTSFSVEQTVKTMTRAKTLTLDSRTNHILLIAAEYTPVPAPAAGRGGRGQVVPDSFSILEVGK